MSAEFSSGIRFKQDDEIKGYRILKEFDPGAFAFPGKALSPDGRVVFFKKYKRPGGASEWYQGFVDYQQELKRRIQADDAARKLCYEFIEFFERKQQGNRRAFYQVFEWVQGGTDLRGVLQNPSGYDWSQRVIFARVMMAGINAIHRASIIHTDLKPENFYLLPEPSIAAKYKLRVIDMDFSLIEAKAAPWNGFEGYVGTPGYMSPEHLTGRVPSKPSDVFTCGLIIGELLGGGHPCTDMAAYDELAKNGALRPLVVQQDIAEVRDSGFLHHVLNGMLRPEATKRPTAEQVLRALSGQLVEWDGRRAEATATPVPPPPAPPAPPVRSAPPVTVPPRLSPPPVETPVARAAPAPAAGVLEIVGPSGQSMTVNLDTRLGRNQFRTWSDEFERFMASEQFRLFRSGSTWMIEHCVGAPNATSLDGVPVTSAMPVRSGTTVAVGRTGKCPLTLRLS